MCLCPARLEELKRRVIQRIAARVGKINSIEALERQLGKKHHQVIPGTDSLVIDNTNLLPEEVAQKIIVHYHFEPDQESSPSQA